GSTARGCCAAPRSYWVARPGTGTTSSSRRSAAGPAVIGPSAVRAWLSTDPPSRRRSRSGCTSTGRGARRDWGSGSSTTTAPRPAVARSAAVFRSHIRPPARRYVSARPAIEAPPSKLTPLDESLLSSCAGRRCLVTGGLGFSGSNLALALAAGGAEVTVVDALVSTHGGDRGNLDDAPGPIDVIDAQVDDVGLVRDAAAASEVIFNLAGQVSHVESMARPRFDLEVNTASQLGFLEILRDVGSKAVVVYTSTRQIFGHPRYLPVDEEHPVSPVDVNGINKWAAEQLHRLYAELYGIRASSVRLTNVYGPRQRLRDDLQGFLPIFIRRALSDEPITV